MRSSSDGFININNISIRTSPSNTPMLMLASLRTPTINNNKSGNVIKTCHVSPIPSAITLCIDCQQHP
jgi:hypothetical protein